MRQMDILYKTNALKSSRLRIDRRLLGLLEALADISLVIVLLTGINNDGVGRETCSLRGMCGIVTVGAVINCPKSLPCVKEGG